MRWPLVKRAGQTSSSGDWWRPFFVSDTSGFVLLVEDWQVTDSGDFGDDDSDEGAGIGLATAMGLCVALALFQRLCEHGARCGFQDCLACML